MLRNVSFSNEHQDLVQIDNHYKDVSESIEEYFNFKTKAIPERFWHEPLNKIKDERLAELELTSSFSILSAIEAAFRIDYLQRCYKRKLKDDLSKAFQEIYKSRETKGSRASLENDILETWKENSSIDKHKFSNLKGALKFRHWIAHGRYWERNFNRYDYFSIYTLAQEIFSSFNFIK